MALQFCAAVAIAAITLAGAALLQVDVGSVVLLVALAIPTGFISPRFTLKRRVKARRERIQRQLLDIVDLLAVTVEAGMSLQPALERACSRTDNDLTQEIDRALAAYRLGLPFATSLTDMADRLQIPPLSSCVRLLVQSSESGTSIADALRAQSDDLRLDRRVRAQEAAQKAPVKMLLPMVGCMFPTIFLVLLGPAAVRLIVHH